MTDYSSYKYIVTEQKEGYLVVQFNRGKANALHQAMIDEISSFFTTAATDPKVRGVVLTGSYPFFSGGVDLTEVYFYDSEGIKHFWGSFLELATQLLSFNKPLIAAVSGHSPAGGCIMAICCDYRLMVEGDKFQIGLNEIAVGIAPRTSILHLYASLIGQRKAYQYLLEGKLLSPSQALYDGLVDDVVPKENLLDKACSKMEQYLKLPPKAFAQTKLMLRKNLIENMRQNRSAELDQLHQQLMSEESRKIMGQVVAYLQSNKK